MFELLLHVGATVLVVFVLLKFWEKKGDKIKEEVKELKDKLDKD